MLRETRFPDSIVTVPPREGAGRVRTSTNEGTLHHIRSLSIQYQ